MRVCTLIHTTTSYIFVYTSAMNTRSAVLYSGQTTSKPYSADLRLDYFIGAKDVLVGRSMLAECTLVQVLWQHKSGLLTPIIIG